MDRGITVAEVTYCNSISVSEHVVMTILALVRNYLPSHQWVVDGGWNIADCVARSYDLEGMNVGTVAQAASARRCFGASSRSTSSCITPIDTGLPTPWKRNWTYVSSDTESLVSGVRCRDDQRAAASGNGGPVQRCTDLEDEARRVSWLTRLAARSAIETPSSVRSRGQVRRLRRRCVVPAAAPRDHPWRTMPFEAMTPHISGSSLSAQARYAAGVREILECWFENRPIRNEYLIDRRREARRSRRALLQRGRCNAGAEEAADFEIALRRRATMSIAASVRSYLAGAGASYGTLLHEHTRDSMHSAQAAHVPGDRFAKCVVLEDERGFLMAVIPATTRWISAPCIVRSSGIWGLPPIAS